MGSALIVAALTVPLAGARADADTDEDAAERAAAEIAVAQERADEAAAAYFDALSELEQLEDEADRLARKSEELEREVEDLRAQVEQVAVNRFVSSGNGGIPILSGVREPSERLQEEVLVSVVTDSSADAMDEFERAQFELEENQQALADTQAELADQRDRYVELREQAEAEVEHLKEVEEQRLRDERIREALEAKRREEQRQRELEAQRAAQEAAEEAARQAAEQAQAVPPPEPETDQGGGDARPPSDDGSDGDGDGDDDGDDGGDEPLPAPPEPAPEPQPEPAPSGGMVCPVAGSSTFSDTYGAPRSGGRSHEGVDMLGSDGTPLVAVVSGNAEMGGSSLGGNSVRLHGDDGNFYFYAHLSAYEGSSRHVAQGEVVGYMGSTGNTDTTHLHFEVHPGGGSSVNPTPYVAGVC